MGRLGGAETSYRSDADVLFVYDPPPGAGEQDGHRGRARGGRRAAPAARAAGPGPAAAASTPTCGRRGAGAAGPHPRVIPGVLPAAGPRPWEAQALLRAAPLAGDPALGSAFVELADPVRYPADGLTPAATTEIRRIKARVDTERLPRGADPATHTKLGRGGLADVEWTVQLLQLRHAAQVPGLRTTRTLEALAAARDAGLLAADDAAALEAAWRIATRARNAVDAGARPAVGPAARAGQDLAGVMRVVGYPPGRDPGQFLDDYRRATRRARAVVERVFYD